MQNGSQFDPSAAFNGGAYMPASSTQTTDNGSSTTTKVKSVNQDTKGILPLTIKQISESYNNSEDKGNFVVDGVELNTISLLGMVFNKEPRVTEVTFTLDDGTGRINCRRWCNETSETQEMESIDNGMYVVLHGSLKSFQAKKEMMVFSVRPVTDFNQVAFHFIECMYVHCRNTKSQIKREGSNSTQPQSTNAAITNGSSSYTQVSGQPSFDVITQKVLEFFSMPEHLATETGGNLRDIATNLRLSVAKIREAIRPLEDEGMIYSTIDELHWKATHNG